MLTEILKGVLCMELAKRFGIAQPTQGDLKYLESVWALIELKGKHLKQTPKNYSSTPANSMSMTDPKNPDGHSFQHLVMAWEYYDDDDTFLLLNSAAHLQRFRMTMPEPRPNLVLLRPDLS